MIGYFLVSHSRPFSLTLIRLGGGGMMGPPLTYRAISATHEALAATLYGQFSFEFPAHFDTKFVTAGGTVPKLRNHLCTCTSDRKWHPKCDVCVTKSYAELSFLTYAFIYNVNMHIFTLNCMKLISFWFIVLQKVSATNFGEKNNKNKRSKKQRNT